jgi:glycosyltransferase involved in cell wall biosynthesis
MLAARMLHDKGVGEFVAAARLLKARHVDCRCVLVGDTDTENPAAIGVARLRAWVDDGSVEWWGHRDDMPSALSAASIVCLPSYREGLPKVLLEAAACGRALVATDVPGCREIVRHEQTGLLVPPRNAAALADAIEVLLRSPEKRLAYATAARILAEKEFAVGMVVEQTLQVYAELLDRASIRPSLVSRNSA